MSDEAPHELRSRTARKREAEAAQALGRRLTQLKPEQLAAAPLGNELHTAIADYQRFPSHGAQRRQLQFIGRLMRDADVDAITTYLDTLEGQSAAARAQFAHTERWREQLLHEPDALTRFIAEHPDVDRQKLRQLIKKAQSAQTEAARKIEARALFRYIVDFVDN